MRPAFIAGWVAPLVMFIVTSITGAPAFAHGGEVHSKSQHSTPQTASPQSSNNLQRSEVRAIARRDSRVAQALEIRPLAYIEVFQPAETDTWRAVVVNRGDETELASVRITDESGTIVDRSALEIGRYPPNRPKREIIDLVADSDKVQRIARQFGGVTALDANATLSEDCCWEVDLYDGGDQPVMRVEVRDLSADITGVYTGHDIAWKMARGEDRESFGGAFSRPYIWVPLMVLFLLVSIDFSRLANPANYDIGAVALLGVSHEFFQRGMIDWSVPLALAPLLWLAGRMLWVFWRGVSPPPPPAAGKPSRARAIILRPVPTVALVVLVVLLAGFRVGVNVYATNVIDVGYAGVAGARLELSGTPPWGNMPSDNPHGDTYGPANYLAYVPFVALLDDEDNHNWGGDMPAANAVAVAADLGTALLLALIGWRWFSRRAAALLPAMWLACPWTALALGTNGNDLLLALSVVAVVAALRSPLARGALVGVATAIKFAPLAMLAPVVRVGSRRLVGQATKVAVGFAAAAALAAGWLLWRDVSFATFFERTIGFQLDRGSPFSVWGLYGWSTAQRIAQVAVAGLLAVMIFVPTARSYVQVAAGVAAALILSQLVVTHWFYLYLPWFMGPLLLVVMAHRTRA